jgi:hypothetical protein
MSRSRKGPVRSRSAEHPHRTLSPYDDGIGLAPDDAARVLYGDLASEQNVYGIGAQMASGTYVQAPTMDRWVSACREALAVTDDPLLTNRGQLAAALAFTGHADQALTLCDGLVPAAAATVNPWAHGVALMALGYAQAETDPTSAVATMRECVELFRQSGMRHMEILVYPSLA